MTFSILIFKISVSKSRVFSGAVFVPFDNKGISSGLESPRGLPVNNTIPFTECADCSQVTFERRQVPYNGVEPRLYLAALGVRDKLFDASSVYCVAVEEYNFGFSFDYFYRSRYTARTQQWYGNGIMII